MPQQDQKVYPPMQETGCGSRRPPQDQKVDHPTQETGCRSRSPQRTRRSTIQCRRWKVGAEVPIGPDSHYPSVLTELHLTCAVVEVVVEEFESKDSKFKFVIDSILCNLSR